MEIIKFLDQSEFIEDYRILEFRNFPSGRYYRLEIVFTDQSILHASEYLSPSEKNYAYHWMNKNKKLIIRWDNLPHHPAIQTFPHHKHENESIYESQELTLKDVIAFIENRLHLMQ